MLTHPFEQEKIDRDALARTNPELHNALIEQEQRQCQEVAENPNILDRIKGRIKKFFRRNQ